LGTKTSGECKAIIAPFPYLLLLQDLISADPSTHGAMFVPVIAGSDKTTVSVATGHQEYHPVYMSPGILTNVARRAHGNALLPVAFLPIPKSECFLYFFIYSEHPSITASKRQRKTPLYKNFVVNFTMPAYTKFLSPLRPELRHLKLSNVLMVIFVKQYMGLAHILLTIQNKFGCPG
jgi:hypothetical protein